MERLKRLIGPAPSERSPEELLAFVKERQERVAGVLQEFRSRMEGKAAPATRAKAPKTQKKSQLEELLQLQEQLAARGLTLADLVKGKEG